MEIADIFCVNKADREGANRIVSEINMILDIKRDRTKREIPVLPTQAVNNIGIDLLLEKIDIETENIKAGDNYEKHRKKKIRYDIMKTVEHRFKDILTEEILPRDKLDSYVDKIYGGQGNPYDLARSIMDNLK